MEGLGTLTACGSPSRPPVEDEAVAAVLLHASRVHDNRNRSRAEALSI